MATKRPEPARRGGDSTTVRDMSYLQETVEDLNIAFEDLRAAGDDAIQRRALKATLDNLYRIRAHRLQTPDYYEHSDSCDDGKITEGITYLRGILTHHLTKQVAPLKQPLFPGASVYPSEDLFPGSNLTWLEAAEVLKECPPPKKGCGKKQADFYRSHVGGQMVLPTIRAARHFLLNDQKLGPL